MLTFCDSSKPAVLDAVKNANFKYKDAFKFNNSGLYS